MALSHIFPFHCKFVNHPPGLQLAQIGSRCDSKEQGTVALQRELKQDTAERLRPWFFVRSLITIYNASSVSAINLVASRSPTKCFNVS